MKKLIFIIFLVLFIFITINVYSETISEKGEKYAHKVFNHLKNNDFEGYLNKCSILAVKDKLHVIYPDLSTEKLDKKMERLKKSIQDNFTIIMFRLTNMLKVDLNKCSIIGVDVGLSSLVKKISLKKKPIKNNVTLYFMQNNEIYRLKIGQNMLIGGNFYASSGSLSIEKLSFTSTSSTKTKKVYKHEKIKSPTPIKDK